MFKKLNKVYDAVFGEESNYPTVSYTERGIQPLPLVNSVRSLQYTVNKQGKIIESLLNQLGLEIEENWNELGLDHGSSFSVIKKKSK